MTYPHSARVRCPVYFQKPVLLFAILIAAIAGNNASAIDPPTRVGSAREPQNPTPQPPVNKPGSDTDSAAREVDKAAPEPRAKAGGKGDSKAGAEADRKKPAQPPPKKLVKRRSVYQVIDPVPRVQSPVVYGPVLTPARPGGVQPVPVPAPGSPLILNGCNGAACSDASGARYHGGVGNVLIGPEGRACSNNGITVQCF